MSHHLSDDEHLTARIAYLRASAQVAARFADPASWQDNNWSLTQEAAHKAVALLDQDMALIPTISPSRGAEEETGPLSSLITDAFGDARYADFEIHCQGRIFRVHRIVICKRSRYFEMACEIDMMEKQAGMIDLVEENPNVVYRILRYMYTGQLALGQDPDGDDATEFLDDAVDGQPETTLSMLDDVEGMTLAEAMGGMGAASNILELEDNDSSGDWLPQDNRSEDADMQASIARDDNKDDEVDQDDQDDEETGDNTSDLSDDAEPDVLYPLVESDYSADRLGVWGPPNHFANARQEEDDRINDHDEDGSNAYQTQRLLNLVHLYAAADRLQVCDMKQDITSIFQEEFDWTYFNDHPIPALQLVKEVYSTTPNADRGLRDAVLGVIKFESAKVVVHLKDTMTELFRIVPQLAFDLFQDATISDKDDEVVQERHYRVYGSHRCEQQIEVDSLASEDQ